ncbi:MAG: DUF1704 domain-containing protein [Candidatus Gracilibacteria bacterium]|nr:DUF1704 domain-containing protein [Candidatus Gracilibacteria bacterium]MDD5178856.1 DUF1704 domain-containing protein [Candidatus Gracilibacteria bacterium]
MSLEVSPSLPAASECLDVRWFSEFKEIGGFQSHSLLEVSSKARESQKAAFLAGEILNPSFSYEKLDAGELAVSEKALLDLKQRIKTEEENPTVKHLYLWKINEKIAEARMLQATLGGDMRNFARYNRFIYGNPDKAVFTHTLTSLTKKLGEAKQSPDVDSQQAAEELEAVLPKVDLAENENEITPPPENVFLALRESVRVNFEGLLGLTDAEKKKYSSKDLKQIFEEALREIGIEEGWEVMVDLDKAVISVNSAENQIGIPPEKNYLLRRVKNLLVHEIGIHVKRNLEGGKSKLKLLSLGLDRYTRGEEGIATLAGKLAENPKAFEEYEMLDRQFAIGLEVGIDGKKRDFRGVFEIMQKYYFFEEMQSCAKLKDPEKQAARKAKAFAKSCDKAWLRCYRSFRGSDCKTPGVCFAKDIAYAEGNIATWYLLGKNQELLGKLTLGKFDQTNPRHLKALFALQIGGITEADLAALGK